MLSWIHGISAETLRSFNGSVVDESPADVDEANVAADVLMSLQPLLE